MKKQLCFLFLLLIGSGGLFSQTKIPSPKEHFGFNIGDDYQLTTFTQTEAYFKKLAELSDLVKLEVIGKTEENRNQYMVIVTSAENQKKLDHYKTISASMANVDGISEDQARAMAKEGKAIVWIDGGLHATETVGIHQLIETLWQLVSRKDAETKNILDHVIVLFTHANPDGHELVSNWYMRNTDPLKRNLQGLPKLYQKYIGHDNNRDFYMLNMKESQNMANQLFIEWIPQIMYNHHQRGPAGSVLAGPPYRDPFNYVYDPLLITGIDAVGAAMYNRLNVENKPGFTRFTGSTFSAWYNGGLRTTTYFHNMVGILTEIIGGPTPESIALVPDRLIPNNNTPNPVTPQKDWRFRQSIDYSVSLNYSVLDYAARNSDHLLYNIYSMGKNSIDRGSNDYWTPFPKKVEAMNTAYAKDEAKKKDGKARSNESDFASRGTLPVSYYDSVYKDPKLRDPRGYIIPINQRDFPTAIKFMNALIRTGVKVERATADFNVEGKNYAKGSYIIKMNQAFRPHILDMFEAQDYPNDFQYVGGPPIRPYDAAGWTLAYQMGVDFDRILVGFDGPFQALERGKLLSSEGMLTNGSAGYTISQHVNDAFIAVNDLLASGLPVYRLKDGSFFIPPGAKAKELLDKSVNNLGIKVNGVSKKPMGDMEKVLPIRIALWDTYGGSMPSGWVRWMMEQYHFPFEVIYPKDLDKGQLNKNYDVIVFVTQAIPPYRKPGDDGRRRSSNGGLTEGDVPKEFHHTMGDITEDKTIPQLKAFLENGGKIITIGSSTNLAYHLGLPVSDALTELNANGELKPLAGEKYFIPGSILQVELDTLARANRGMLGKTDVMFSNSPVFHLAPQAISSGQLTPLAWFPNNKPLRSGWAWGEGYLENGVAAFEAKVGKGYLYAFGPEITFRAQSHGSFKWLFNQLYREAK